MSKERREVEPQSQPRVPEAQRVSPEEYLDKYGVTAHLKDVVTLLVEQRPEKPLEFVADYLSNSIQPRTAVARSYRYIRLTKRNRQAFIDNLASAYSVIARNSDSEADGLTGAEYRTLLQTICSDFPHEVVTSLTQVLDKRGSDVVSFPVFVAGVQACLVYEEFFEYAELLFNALDADSLGRVDLQAFIAVLKQMNSPEAPVHAQGWSMPSHQLLDNVNSLIGTEGKTTVTYKEFVMTIVRLFLGRGEVS
mmetsp:Transcript_18177/g.43294  ORF Transcript_18177/g.43294 Transcript_18177/m.43294 type:complete len:250 (+) Transcript_18177:96-845(+)|eukprot:CAMPEP_0177730670 /NCGR_PEP_ID=MMETSP0484_2-20121128/22118_1 /TAXON_ID=354590 /ORGANISM="Rhodomonas lens, Strain RHODO" /LENGTH=249 /DNA_ID=CAMNT_0019243685 /DNA_START=41 /DNA_END=790 /DNA_ORIENTATION=-